MAIQTHSTSTPTAAVIDIETAVRLGNDAFEHGVEIGSADAVAAVYADDAVLLAPDVARLEGRQAIRDYWAGGLAAGIRGVTLETIELDAVGDLAVEVGAFTLRLSPSEQPESIVLGKYLVVHRRQADGAWRWAIDVFNTNGAAR